MNLALTSTGSKLKWSPPTLVSPEEKLVPATGDTTLDLDNAKDYVIKLPATKKTGETVIVGGRNIVLIGGQTTIPTHTTKGKRNFTIKDKPGVMQGRIVHIEGVEIDGSGGGEGDAFGIAAPSAIIQLQNIRATGLMGSLATSHADVIQTYGGFQELRIDHFTGASNYNNFYFRRENNPLGPEIGIVRISNTNNFGYNNAVGSDPAATLNAISLGTQPVGDDNSDGIICELNHPVYLEEFYGQPPAGQAFGAFLWPGTGKKLCSAQLASDGKSADWPYWRDSKVFGVVKLGPPSTGDFAPADVVGLGYVSPGYVADPVTDTVKPSVPQDIVAQAVNPYGVNLTWSASTDNAAVNEYAIVRDGVRLTTTQSLNYVDTTVAPKTTYKYMIRAIDSSNNLSEKPTEIPVTTPRAGDLDLNGSVNIFDFSKLLVKINKAGTIAEGDLDRSGQINIQDISLMLAEWDR